MDLLSLDEDGVATLFEELGFSSYEARLKEHGITGEVLVHLDHEALKDVGIHSVGQRLAILRAVYNLKVQQSIPVEEGHYVPPSGDMEELASEHPSRQSLPQDQLLDMIQDQGESTLVLKLRGGDVFLDLDELTRASLLTADRIRNLEMEIRRFSNVTNSSGEEGGVKNGTQKTIRPPARSPVSNSFPHPLSNSSTDPNGSTRLGLPDSPHSPMTSPQITQDFEGTGLQSSNDYNVAPPFTSAALTPTTPTAPTNREDANPSLSSSTRPIPPSYSSLAAPLPPLPPTSTSASGPRIPTTEKDRSEKHGDNPYRSFRVTLEDPCYKVLPAALKKYKINDDWRQYALFICFGNTERCLAYDEKPLLLFQRLKEENANPVFMLRHIKDIKSPIAVASGKHALRRDKRAANAGAGLDKLPSVNREGVAISRPTRLHHPPVLLATGKDKDKTSNEAEDDGTKPLASPRGESGYCISIYPYLAEREDEFDVSVGDTFNIVSKTKNWWVVYRDLGPTSISDMTPRKSAWVPAGCLLETTVAPLSLADPSAISSSSPSNAANVPIEPIYVVSVSTPAIALMDYTKNGSDELDAKKGTALRILKRYNHWSYAIKEDGHRGWLPSWFCGRLVRDNPGTSPTASTAPRKVSSTSDESTLGPNSTLGLPSLP